MTEPLTFFVPGRPQAMQRPRVTRNGTYTPKKSVQAKEMVVLAARQAMREAKHPGFFDGAVFVTVTAWFMHPKSTPKSQQVDLMPMTVKPDIENIAKMVLDACTGTVWTDDAQVSALDCSKWRVRDKVNEGIWVVVDSTVTHLGKRWKIEL